MSVYTIEKKPPGNDMRHGWEFVYDDTRLSKVQSRFAALKGRMPPKWHARLVGPGINEMFYKDDAPAPMLPATPSPTMPHPIHGGVTAGSIADAAQDDDDDEYFPY